MQTFDRGTTREIEKHSKLERNIESNRLTEGPPFPEALYRGKGSRAEEEDEEKLSCGVGRN